MKRILFILIAVFLLVALGFLYLILPDEVRVDSDSLEQAEGGIRANNVDETTPVTVQTSQEKLRSLGGDPLNKTNPLKTILVTLGEQETRESALLSTGGRYLNFEEGIIDVFGPTMFEGSLSRFLRKESFQRPNGNTVNYEQKIKFSDKLVFTEYVDDDYLNGTNATGIALQEDDPILDYTISFVQDVTWSDLVGSTLWFFGREYYVHSAEQGASRIEMLSDPYAFLLHENEKIIIAYPTVREVAFSLERFEEDHVSLRVGETVIHNLQEKLYFEEGLYIVVEEITYSSKGISSIGLVVSPRHLVLVSGEVRDDELSVKGFSTSFIPQESEDLESITLQWEATEELFLSAVSTIDIPFFKNMQFSMTKTRYDPENKPYTNVTLSTSSFEMVATTV